MTTGEATRAALIYSPLPDAETARAIAGTLLDEGLIACANLLGPIESVFLWKGQRECASETAALFKTTAEALKRAVNRLHALHPYETPVIIATICDAAHPDTLAWISEQTR
ncbi:MAG: divalent-cation tolerance protein CutA [Erythrobacter sp.]|uniref:divalent-cation tolerance protein CutA n=1 Tax=Erythrobacter sp. TaxID=1042 RepID=UPI002622B793|nr:divalent-cation tolerance protein CutA [Erythrobacter sp.]MDJ0978507.1 divalent-cation tolerance protein CutA [Erythrobacter sp.]